MKYMVAVLHNYRVRQGCPLDTPMFVFVDNHYSRSKDIEKTQEIVDLCEENSVEIVFLPPHLSQVCQPNDRGLHSHLKAVYSVKLEEDLGSQLREGRRSRYQRLRKVDFNRVFVESLRTVSTDQRSKQIILNGFRKTGLLPKIDRAGFEPPVLPNWYVPPEQRDESPDSSVEAWGAFDVDDEIEQLQREASQSQQQIAEPQPQIPEPQQQAPELHQQTPTHSPPLTFEEATDESGTAIDIELLEQERSEIKRRKLLLAEQYYAANHRLRQVESLLGRRSSVSSASTSDADMHLFTPDVVMDKLRKETSVKLKEPVREHVRCHLPMAQESNAPVNTIGRQTSTRATRAARKAQEEDEKRIVRYRSGRKRSMFAVFCEERGLDVDGMDDETLLETSKQFDEAIKDDPFKKGLQQRLKKSKQESSRRPKPVEERLETLKLKPAFLMLLSAELGHLPEDPQPAEVGDIVALYDMKTKEERQTLAKQWKWCRHNPRARARLDRVISRGKFKDFCYHTHGQYPEHMEETLLFQTAQEYCAAKPDAPPLDPVPIIVHPEPEAQPRNSRYGLRKRAAREVVI